ncbi:MAG: hypothetical protein AB2556_16100 [Candidatus Thiodiazotropha sp.]
MADRITKLETENEKLRLLAKGNLGLQQERERREQLEIENAKLQEDLAEAQGARLLLEEEKLAVGTKYKKLLLLARGDMGLQQACKERGRREELEIENAKLREDLAEARSVHVAGPQQSELLLENAQLREPSGSTSGPPSPRRSVSICSTNSSIASQYAPQIHRRRRGHSNRPHSRRAYSPSLPRVCATFGIRRTE